jgi:hypothetical protein
MKILHDKAQAFAYSIRSVSSFAWFNICVRTLLLYAIVMRLLLPHILNVV